MVQRLDGGLTIGDTHAYDEPFEFDLDEDAYHHLCAGRGAARPAAAADAAALGRRLQRRSTGRRPVTRSTTGRSRRA